MKKTFLIVCLFFGLQNYLFAQMKINDSIIVPIKNYAGIEIKGVYKLVNEKKGKKEYQLKVYFENTTSKEIFYKRNGNYSSFINVNSKGSDGCPFNLFGTNAKKKIGKNKINIIYPAKLYEADSYCVKWYNENEVPEFEFKINSEITLENDYSRYN